MAHLSCIGCGLVGSAWAVVFAKAGHKVRLYDHDHSSLENAALPRIKDTLTVLKQSGALSEPITAIMARISCHAKLEEALTGADYVQESVSEKLSIKQELFPQIAQYVRPDTILASSTSAIMGSEFMLGIDQPERALVVHPVNPPSLIPLVELCGTPKTSQATIDKVQSLMTDLGMKPIILNKEIDGFILNRLQYTLVAEAMHLVGEGYCSAADIDRVITDGLALRWASIGPFAVSHLNSSGGFAGFVAQLGDMMKNMGRSAQTDYAWDADMAAQIHDDLIKDMPMDKLPELQNWRNAQILATRQMQARGKDELP